MHSSSCSVNIGFISCLPFSSTLPQWLTSYSTSVYSGRPPALLQFSSFSGMPLSSPSHSVVRIWLLLWGSVQRPLSLQAFASLAFTLLPWNSLTTPYVLQPRTHRPLICNREQGFIEVLLSFINSIMLNSTLCAFKCVLDRNVLAFKAVLY